jgi:hypothetical protein
MRNINQEIKNEEWANRILVPYIARIEKVKEVVVEASGASEALYITVFYDDGTKFGDSLKISIRDHVNMNSDFDFSISWNLGKTEIKREISRILKGVK